MGRPPAIEDGEIEELLKERDKVALSTGEIADEFDCHRKTAHQRLKKLEKKGVLDSDGISQADAWYLADGKDPIVMVSDGGDLMPLKEWYETKLRDFYPLRIVPLTLVTAFVAWWFADPVAALMVAVLVYTIYPATLLAFTLGYMKIIKPLLNESDEEIELIAG